MEPLNKINYLNLVGYILNTVVTFAASPVFGFPSNGELSRKYQTLVTPKGLTFSIWGIIFLAQGVFTVVQMLPAYRTNKLVQNGVSYLYFTACVAQSIWTFVFGWITAAFAVNVNAFVVAAGGGRVAMISAAYSSLVWAVLVAVFALVYLRRPDYTITSVLIWATFGIISELNDPLDSITAVFTQNEISALRYAVIAVCALVAVATAGFVVFRFVKGRDVEEVAAENKMEKNINNKETTL